MVTTIIDNVVQEIWNKNPTRVKGSLEFVVKFVEIATCVALHHAGGPKYVQSAGIQVNHPFPITMFQDEVKAHSIIGKRGGIYETLFLNIALHFIAKTKREGRGGDCCNVLKRHRTLFSLWDFDLTDSYVYGGPKDIKCNSARNPFVGYMIEFVVGERFSISELAARLTEAMLSEQKGALFLGNKKAVDPSKYKFYHAEPLPRNDDMGADYSSIVPSICILLTILQYRAETGNITQVVCPKASAMALAMELLLLLAAHDHAFAFDFDIGIKRVEDWSEVICDPKKAGSWFNVLANFCAGRLLASMATSKITGEGIGAAIALPEGLRGKFAVKVMEFVNKSIMVKCKGGEDAFQVLNAPNSRFLKDLGVLKGALEKETLTPALVRLNLLSLRLLIFWRS
ncbi:hypothetical protein TL16_g00930 [Triparma laevis f. inornata]|uniref:Uncharacterized protein n=1 Tax=Triparma laevis f. inornata TaxID=1714386 RepID=A0A9W6ZEM6_9STRA|nr:hypothetical protein TL16_g00930 [Triparma laevis f. inornata]